MMTKVAQCSSNNHGQRFVESQSFDYITEFFHDLQSHFRQSSIFIDFRRFSSIFIEIRENR